MNNKLLYIIVIIIFVIGLLYLMNTLKEGFKNKIKNIKETKKNANCGKDGCPITHAQNAIYKLHVEYKPERDKNHMLAHNTESGNFFYKTKGPANIFIIRHGEKIKSKNALDCNGILRSTYIPKLVTEINKMGFGIHAIVSAYDYRSMHQEQTVSLTSWLMDIPSYLYGEQSQSDVAVNTVFTNPFFSGKTVLFCWEHGCSQELIKNIITIGPKIKGLSNYKFVNSEGNSKLPYWHHNNYKSIIYFDENLNYKTFEEKFTSCLTIENDKISYDGQMADCK